jgi:hypothetical protein
MRASPTAAFASRHYNRHVILPEDVLQAANLGLRIFPVSLLAKLKGTPNLFIGAATSNISSLEELAATAYPLHEWRAALGPSSLCALQFDGETVISLTDMVKSFEGGSALIEQWLKNKDTVLFLGVWEQIYNPGFNSLEFEGIRNEAGRNSFYLSAKKWIEASTASLRT